MKTIDIKGTPYVKVNERVKHFRGEYPGYCLQTEIVNMADDWVLIKASVIGSHDGVVYSTGHAYEEKGSSYINKNSHIENAETSAVGRALGLFGIGIDAEIASADEVINASKDFTPITLSQSQMIESLLLDAEMPEKYRQKVYSEKEEYSKGYASKVIARLQELQPENIVEYNGGSGNQKQLDKAIKNRLERET